MKQQKNSTKPAKVKKATPPKKPATPKFLLNKVNFIKFYDQLGIIEAEPGVYSRAYEISLPAFETDREFNSTQVHICMENILSRFVQDFTCQMLVRNSPVDEDTYLEKVLLPEDKEEPVTACIKDYNDVIRDNINIGHNNYKRTVYFILSAKADTPDEAMAIFENVDAEVKEKFSQMYGYIAVGQELNERLYTLYDLHNPAGMSFDEFKNMREYYTTMTTKESIYPRSYAAKERDHIKVGDKYVRMLFINSLPTSVPDSVLSDLMSVSSNSLLSVIYEPIDTELGSQLATKLVDKNTKIHQVPLRETVEDRKHRRVQEQKKHLKENEAEYFHIKAKEVFTSAIENNESVMLASFVIALFADSKEDLDRDTKLLKLSASKFATQIRVCDLMQDLAFQSALPLARSRLNVYRTFRSSQLATMQPLDIQQLFNRSNAFHGLNGISDNLILLDRRNYLSGIISGIKFSGKSFECKREIANTLMTTHDEVILITDDKNSYTKFVSTMGGKEINAWMPDVFKCENVQFKKLFLSAFMTYRLNILQKHLIESEKKEVLAQIEKEADMLYRCENWNAATNLINEDKAKYGSLIRALSGYKPSKTTDNAIADAHTRLKAITVSSDSELISTMFAAYNYIMKSKKENKCVWLYVDAIDPLLFTSSGSDFLIGLITETEKGKIPITLVVQDSVYIIANTEASIEYDYLLSKINYFKLLSQGPVERRKYTQRLNIPDSLVSFITDREPGEGIIITPSANIAFNDRFEGRTNPFYSRFYSN